MRVNGYLKGMEKEQDSTSVTPKFFSWISSHNTFGEGYGRKVHLADEDMNTLCGYYNFYNIADEVGLEWITQPDPDGELCKKCKKIALKSLTQPNDPPTPSSMPHSTDSPNLTCEVRNLFN